MKKLLLLLGLILMIAKTNAQNCLGESYIDVKKIMIDKGYIVNEGRTTKDDLRYISGSDDVGYRIYYFSVNNVCIFYSLYVNGATFENYERSLLDKGYKRLSDFYILDEFRAEIIWSKVFEGYTIFFRYKD